MIKSILDLMEGYPSKICRRWDKFYYGTIEKKYTIEEAIGIRPIADKKSWVQVAAEIKEAVQHQFDKHSIPLNCASSSALT